MSDGKPAARLGDQDTGHGKYGPTPITTGAGTVTIGGKPAARIGDMLAPHHPGVRVIAQGSASVKIEGKPAARVGDSINCGGVIASGDGSVRIGDAAPPIAAGPFELAFAEFLEATFDPKINVHNPEEREALLDSINIKYEARYPGDTVGQLKPEYRSKTDQEGYGETLTPDMQALHLNEDLSLAHRRATKTNLESIDICVKDADGSPAVGLRYFAVTADDSERSGRLDAQGNATESELKPGQVLVHVGSVFNAQAIRQITAALRESLDQVVQREEAYAKRLIDDLAEKPALKDRWAYQKTGIRGVWNGVLGLMSAAKDLAPITVYQEAAANAWERWKYTGDAPFQEAFSRAFSSEQHNALMTSLGVRPPSLTRKQLATISAQMVFLWEASNTRSLLGRFVASIRQVQEELDLTSYIDASDDELGADLMFTALAVHDGAELTVDITVPWRGHMAEIGGLLSRLATELEIAQRRTHGVGFTQGRVDIQLVRPEYKILKFNAKMKQPDFVEVDAYFENSWQTPWPLDNVMVIVDGAKQNQVSITAEEQGNNA